MSDLTTEEKQELLRELREARYSGVLRVKFRERDVTYRSDAELKKAIQDLEGEVEPKTRRRVGFAAFGTGL
jgi:hypothetical protein